jgi:hypothetical protein
MIGLRRVRLAADFFARGRAGFRVDRAAFFMVEV